METNCRAQRAKLYVLEREILTMKAKNARATLWMMETLLLAGPS